jgi:hypothetical protein
MDCVELHCVGQTPNDDFEIVWNHRKEVAEDQSVQKKTVALLVEPGYGLDGTVAAGAAASCLAHYQVCYWMADHW